MNIVGSCRSETAIKPFVNWFSGQIRLLALASLAVCLAAPAARSTVLKPVTESELATQAHLIFQGVVEKIEYQSSTPRTKNERPIPHTFVTFRIEEVLKGQTVNRQSITLRFIGGPYSGSKVLIVPKVPIFEVGDRDVLFVAGNGTRTCPLVGWNQGRFRIIDGFVYGDEGREVWESEKGKIAYGPVHDLPQVTTVRVGNVVLQRKWLDRRGENAQKTEPVLQLGRRMDHKSFLAHVRRMVEIYTDPDRKSSFAPVASADPKPPFYVALTPSPMRGDLLLRHGGNGKPTK